MLAYAGSMDSVACVRAARCIVEWKTPRFIRILEKTLQQLVLV